MQTQDLRPFLGDRQTYEAPAVHSHEVDRLGRHELGRHSEVTLVLPVFIIDHHDHAAGFDLLQSLLHGREILLISHTNPCSLNKVSVRPADVWVPPVRVSSPDCNTRCT